ncbi:MAG: polyphosphate kinase 2 family protein [Chthonomonas sp.]|nr:polyphosphate kinase 2 family protein [Chthonomonas sp.]
MFAERVDGSKSIRLSEIPTNSDGGLSKEIAEKQTKALGDRLGELADLMYFAGQHPLLVILQGMDTSGKDGTIRFLLQHLNAQGTSVASFKVPTPRELSQDFLWRCHQDTPRRGAITIFNRSHYEDVLVVRVHSLTPEERWRKRYGHIRAFEDLLSDNETIITKFFLHISKEEQEERLLAREKETEKAWKLSAGDWKEREYWQDYQDAYEDAINKTSSPEAPWFVVPSDRKWFRNLAIVEALVQALERHEEGWMEKLEKIGTEAKAELAEYRSTQRGSGAN